VKNNQRRLYRQIASQFRGHRHFPVEISDFEASHGRQVRWTLRARNATGAIRERWAGATWIIKLVSTGRRDSKPFHHVNFFITTLRTSPKALLRLVRQRWAIENQWHWPRDPSTRLSSDRGRSPLRPTQRRAGVGTTADVGTEPAALQRFPVDPRWPNGGGA